MYQYISENGVINSVLFVQYNKEIVSKLYNYVQIFYKIIKHKSMHMTAMPEIMKILWNTKTKQENLFSFYVFFYIFWDTIKWPDVLTQIILNIEVLTIKISRDMKGIMQ